MFSSIKSFLSRTQSESGSHPPTPPPPPPLLKVTLPNQLKINLDDLHAELKLKLEAKQIAKQNMPITPPSVEPIVPIMVDIPYSHTEFILPPAPSKLSPLSPIPYTCSSPLNVKSNDFVDIPLLLPPPPIQSGYSCIRNWPNIDLPPPPPLIFASAKSIPPPPPLPPVDWKPKRGIASEPEPRYTSWNQILSELKERNVQKEVHFDRWISQTPENRLGETCTEDSYVIEATQTDLMEFPLSRSLMRELDTHCEERTEYGYVPIPDRDTTDTWWTDSSVASSQEESRSTTPRPEIERIPPDPRVDFFLYITRQSSTDQVFELLRNLGNIHH